MKGAIVTLTKRLFRAGAMLLALFLVLGTLPVRAAEAPSLLNVSYADDMRALYIRTAHGEDFPSAQGLSKKELKAELDDIIAFAKQYGYNTIYFEAVSGAEAMYRSGKYGFGTALYEPGGFFSRLFKLDPLEYLAKEVKREGLAVVAVVDLFGAAEGASLPDNKRNLAVKNKDAVLPANGSLWFNPSEKFTQKLAVAAIKELAKSKYGLSGIALRSFAYPSADFELSTTESEKRALLTELLAQMNATAKGVPIGLFSDAVPAGREENGTLRFAQRGFDGFAELPSWVASGAIQFVVPVIEAGATGGYADALSGWGLLSHTGSEKRPLYAFVQTERLAGGAGDARYTDPLEPESRLYLAKNNVAQNGEPAAFAGCVVSGYREMKGELSATAQSLAAVFAPQPVLPENGFTLTYPREFVLTRPATPITVWSPTYYITGLSDGSAPVLLDGDPVGTGRTFGALVTLENGRNEFTFTCGGQELTAVITRGSGGGAAAAITEPRQSSLFPWRQELTYAGDDLTLSCVAPSGAEMTARVDGQTVELTQEAPADDGIPARFSGTLKLTEGYPVDETTDIGGAVYTMRYDGITKDYEATGTLYAVGRDARLAVEVTDQRGDTSAVNTAADFRDNMIGSVEQGARDYVVEQTYSFFRLSCGGWVDREDVSVLTGRVDIDAKATGAPAFVPEERLETFQLPMGGARPYYLTQLTDETLTVTLYNTSGLPESWDAPGSELFTAVTAEYDVDANSTRITFALKKPLWGYNVEYHGDEVWIFGKRTPKLSDDPAKPLLGVTVVVDAGHGGNDPGALGVAGELGPAEKQLNYLNACMTSIRLEQLGATVIQTQTADERLSYARRMDPARDSRADFYICLHHNSTAETVDSTNARGVEVYYIEQLSKPFAQVMLEEVSAATGRKARGAYFATFRVTQMTHTPSLLVELGFVVSPQEYEELCQPLSVYRASIGVANSVIRMVRQAQ